MSGLGSLGRRGGKSLHSAYHFVGLLQCRCELREAHLAAVLVELHVLGTAVAELAADLIEIAAEPERGPTPRTDFIRELFHCSTHLP